ncbi:hypothetical protein PR048_011456 [Dryococelus australis]|uniref:Uncharacterized protein n=1 Tax=Dryococelus australis TaxID=614101 RepID=A0ABQ9HLN2_9NEOP|nr:hypothetical protein PR048_011456 [Dryococelus australis]
MGMTIGTSLRRHGYCRVINQDAVVREKARTAKTTNADNRQSSAGKEDEVLRLKARSCRQDKMAKTFRTMDKSTGVQLNANKLRPMRVKLGGCDSAMECENPANDPGRRKWRPVRLDGRRVPGRYTTTAPAASGTRPYLAATQLRLQLQAALGLTWPLHNYGSSCKRHQALPGRYTTTAPAASGTRPYLAATQLRLQLQAAPGLTWPLHNYGSSCKRQLGLTWPLHNYGSSCKRHQALPGRYTTTAPAASGN